MGILHSLVGPLSGNPSTLAAAGPVVKQLCIPWAETVRPNLYPLFRVTIIYCYNCHGTKRENRAASKVDNEIISLPGLSNFWLNVETFISLN